MQASGDGQTVLNLFSTVTATEKVRISYFGQGNMGLYSHGNITFRRGRALHESQDF